MDVVISPEESVEEDGFLGHTIRGISIGPNRGSTIITLPICNVNSNVSWESIFQTIYFSITYCLIFTGYYVTVTFVSVIYPDYSFIGFAMLYTTYSIGSLLAPSIGKKIGLKNSIICSSCSYILFVFSINFGNVVLYLISAMIVGFSSGIIWLHQGIWITRISENLNKRTGFFQGIFYSIFNLNNIIGNIIGIIILSMGKSVLDMLWYMICISGIGVVMTFFITPLSSSIVLSDDDLFSTFNNRLQAVLTVSKLKQVRLLMPIMAYQSAGICLSLQILPKLIYKSSHKLSDDNDIAGKYNMYAFLGYGIGSSVFAFLWGKIYDNLGWMWIYIPLFTIEISCLIMYIVFDKLNIHPYMWILVATLRGIIDYGTNTLLCCSISKYFITQSTSVYGLYRCEYALFYIPISIITGLIDFQWIVLLTLVLMIISAWSYVIFTKIIETK